MTKVADRSIIERLQQQLMSLQKQVPQGAEQTLPIGLGVMENSFPGQVFSKGAVHELISHSSEEASCTSAFISVILGKLMPASGYCLWISTVPRRSIFPPALKGFGIDPERVLFVDAGRSKDTLWAIEEALKCEALSAVIGELTELSFNDSRRLQLAVEKSNVTGFIHRFRPKTENAVACVSRWKIKALASDTGELPGLGFSRWQVDLLKVRNGKTGSWQMEWSPKGLHYIDGEHNKGNELGQLQMG